MRSKSRSKRKTKEYVLFTKEGCPFCSEAVQTLKDQKKSFDKRNHTKLTKKFQTLIQATPYQELLDNGTYNYVPMIFKKIKGKYVFIGGNDQLHRFLINT